MSTFSGLNTAYSALVASRIGIDTIGQNVANSATVGYSRQRVATFAQPALAAGTLGSAIQVGQGVGSGGVHRVENALTTARVAQTSAASGYWSTRASALGAIETILAEPGDSGLASGLQEFWADWQDVGNYPGQASSASVLIENAGVLSTRLSQGYTAIANEWSLQRGDAQSMVATINTAATQVAHLNSQILTITAAGGAPNELLDARAMLTASIAAMSGAAVRTRSDGMVDVVVDGNALVSGTTSRQLQLTGATDLAGTATARVTVGWADNPSLTLNLGSGQLGASLALLAPASDGAVGSYAVIAEGYNALAVSLATTVNTVHATGATPDGTTGHDFFALDSTVPPAMGLRVVPADGAGIAAGAAGAGAANGAVADAIAQLGVSASGPDSVWSTFVVGIGVTASTANGQAKTASLAATSASTAQLSESSVDLDEETTMLLTYQHAYEGAARVMTAIDQMLDVLINRTGLVGR